jgi:hypothetical protein
MNRLSFGNSTKKNINSPKLSQNQKGPASKAQEKKYKTGPQNFAPCIKTTGKTARETSQMLSTRYHRQLH